jgi:DNA-binding transcriptional LysR family regulator
MPRYRAAHPAVPVSLVESESDDNLLAHIERGELDLAFALLPLPEGPFAHTELMADPWMLLVPADSPLAARDAVPLAEAAGLPLIGARLHRCRMHVDASFNACGLKPKYVFRTDENGLVHSLVTAGMGAGILPQLAVDPRHKDLTAIPLGPGLPPRIIALAWHRDRHQPPTAQAFITMAQQLCAKPDRRVAPEAPSARP